MSIFNKIKIASRLWLILIIYSVCAGAIVTFLICKGVNKEIAITISETEAIEFQRPLEKLLELVPAHQDLVERVSMGDSSARAALANNESSIDSAFDALMAAQEKFGKDLKLNSEDLAARGHEKALPSSVRQEWQDLKLSGASLKLDDERQKHTDLLAHIRLMIDYAGLTGNLPNDPILDSMYLIDVLWTVLPQTQDRLPQVIRAGRAILTTKTSTESQRNDMATFAAMLQQDDQDRTTSDVDTVISENRGDSPTLKTVLLPATKEYASANRSFVDLTHQLAISDKPTMTAGEFEAAGASALSESFKLWDISAEELRILLQKRIDAAKNLRFYSFLMTAIGLMVIGGIVTLVNRSINRPLGEVVKIADLLLKGRLGKSASGSTAESVQVAASPTPEELEAALKQMREEIVELRVRAAITNMTSIVSEADLKGDILTINDKFCQVSKYSREELLGKPHNTLRHPDMPKETFKTMWATIGRGEIFRGIIKNRAKDGTPYYVDAVVAPVFGDNGKPKKYIGVRYDITELEIERQSMRGILDAINSSYAYVELDTKGIVLTANSIFLHLFGYRLEEIVGRHHRVFVEASQANSAEYNQLWSNLAGGSSCSGVYKRVAKDGRELWIKGVFAPVKDETGRVMKVVKIATDVTAEKMREADYTGQITAIGKAQAVIEFDLEGKILTANENFLSTLGYRLDEIVGQHHSLFVPAEHKTSAEYRQFWRDLGEGKHQAAEFKRLGKGGKEIWIQASYNPIFDLNGKPYKVVKYATDVTDRKLADAKLVKTLDIVSQNSQALSAASDELSANSQQMVSNAEETSTQAGAVSAAAEQVSKNVQTVAAATEEMSASIREIAKNAMDAAKVANAAVKAAHTTNVTITKLGESSSEIGAVVKVITSIAQQTNLLALNATIEAARAGEAGKGFAVVANEVKELAKETAKATEDISQKIETIQGDTKSAVMAIAEIGAIINKINDYQNTIASAVDEQTATTKEITRHVSEASKGSSDIAQNIVNVANAAKSTSSGASDTQRASDELSRMAAELQDVVTFSKK